MAAVNWYLAFAVTDQFTRYIIINKYLLIFNKNVLTINYMDVIFTINNYINVEDRRKQG